MSLSSKSFSSDVTVQPAPGAQVVLGDVTLNGVSHLVVTGVGGGGASLKIGGNDIDESDGCSSHVTFEYLTYTRGVVVEPRSSCAVNMDLVWDHDRFDNLGSQTWEGRFNVQALNSGPHQPDGVTISNSHFGGSGAGSDCSDGIDILGNADGTVIGPGNEFTGMAQGTCAAHVDPVQFDGEYADTVITGNYFHGNGDGSGGLMSPDEDGAYTVTNNVFDETGTYPWAVVMGGCFDPAPCTVSHNVFINAGVEIGPANEGPATLGAIVKNNVFDNTGIVILGSGNTYTATYNLNAGLNGTGNINGTPLYTTSPATGYYHYQLAPTSPGHNAASDGKNIGIGP